MIDGKPITKPALLDAFAQRDGFKDWAELRSFWAKHHPKVAVFHGLIIYWRDFAAAL